MIDAKQERLNFLSFLEDIAEVARENLTVGEVLASSLMHRVAHEHAETSEELTDHDCDASIRKVEEMSDDEIALYGADLTALVQVFTGELRIVKVIDMRRRMLRVRGPELN